MKKKEKNIIKPTKNAETLGAVHTHTHTHVVLVDRKSDAIFASICDINLRSKI